MSATIEVRFARDGLNKIRLHCFLLCLWNFLTRLSHLDGIVD